MVTPLAKPSDVRLEVDTSLEDSRITSVLKRVARDNDRVNNAASMENGLRKDLEAAMAAYHIATQLDRRVRQKSIGSGSKTYEGGSVDGIRERIIDLDPSDGAVIGEAPNWTVTTSEVTDD